MDDNDLTRQIVGPTKEQAQRQLDAFERAYRSGQKEHLMSALMVCLVLSSPQLEIPPWVRDALMKAYAQRPKSWDDLFGPPVPKGKSVAAFNRHMEKNVYVIWRVKQLTERGVPIERALRDAGKEIGMSAGSARQVYYDERANIEFNAIAEPMSLFLTQKVGENASDDAKAAWVRNNLPSKLVSKKLT